MPRYFFDIADNGDASPDVDGLELAGMTEARAEALATLGSLAKDELSTKVTRRQFEITVRDKSGPQLRLSLTVAIEELPRHRT